MPRPPIRGLQDERDPNYDPSKDIGKLLYLQGLLRVVRMGCCAWNRGL